MSTTNFGVILASAQIAIAVGTAIGYALAGDWKRAVYWVAAAVLTTMVTLIDGGSAVVK